MSELDNPQRTPADRVKVGHLVAGLVFLGIAATWALHAAGAIDDLDTRFVLPAVLVVAGILGLTATVTQNRRRTTPPGTTDEKETLR